MVGAAGIAVRQDEGGPKFLQTEDAANGQFRGARTWLTADDSNVLVDLQQDPAQILGMGYYVRAAARAWKKYDR